MTISLEGKMYLTGSTECLPVSVKLTQNDYLEIYRSSGDELLQSHHRLDVTINSKLGNLPREILLPLNAQLTLEPGDDSDDWLYKNGSGKTARLERNNLFVVLSVILTPLACFGIFKYVIPALAIQFADLVPQSVKVVASAQTLEGLDRTILEVSDLPENQKISLSNNWHALTERLELEQEFRFLFRNSKAMGANAFALPDGTIVVTDDLVKLIDNEQWLTAIILHEIGHVTQNHSMRLVAESLASSFAIYYLIGDIGGLTELIAGVSNTIIQNQFSQELEWEADNYALAMSAKIALPKEAFAGAMEKLLEKNPDMPQLNWLNSHPLMRERIHNARNEASK